MDNYVKLVDGKEAREELNEIGYPLIGIEMERMAIQSMIVSMAKQIKDLQDIVSGSTLPNPEGTSRLDTSINPPTLKRTVNGVWVILDN